MGYPRLTLAIIQDRARLRGVECISTTFTTVAEKLEFRCPCGHTWQAFWGNIWSHSHGCPKCAGNAKITPQDVHSLAIARGFTCEVVEPFNGHTPLTWRCLHKHPWRTSYSAVRAGGGCPTCSGKKPHSQATMHVAAERKSGRYLSTFYRGAHQFQLLECEAGHRWETAARVVYWQNSWCPFCTPLNSPRLRQVRHTVMGWGGTLLVDGDRRTTRDETLSLTCAQEHRFSLSPRQLAQGQWCPYGCARLNSPA
jgi:hypothetical protein